MGDELTGRGSTGTSHGHRSDLADERVRRRKDHEAALLAWEREVGAGAAAVVLRDQAAAARDRAADERDRAADARDADADRRDTEAARHDLDVRELVRRALKRDAAAERRDRAAEARDTGAKQAGAGAVEQYVLNLGKTASTGTSPGSTVTSAQATSPTCCSLAPASRPGRKRPSTSARTAPWTESSPKRSGPMDAATDKTSSARSLIGRPQCQTKRSR